MNAADLPFLSVAALGDLLRRREVSPVEAVDAYLERVESLNGHLRAYLTVTAEEARRAAREAEGEIAAGQYRGPLHGVPVAVKDQLHTAGVRTTGGSPIFNEFVPDTDATAITRLKAAGALLLGKLNMTEFATSGLSHQFDPPRNPWNPARSTGGSSSGSGAATAAFMCAAALGEDTGGSVRFPAAWCGLAGLRPTWGLVSRYGLMPGIRSMDTIGPLARTVEDCALTLQAIAGPDPLDRHTRAEPPPDYRAALTGEVRGLRFGVIREITGSAVVDDEVRQATQEAAATLAGLGAAVEEVSIPLAANVGPINAGIRIEAPVTYGELLRQRRAEIGHDNRIGYLVGSILPAPAYYKAVKLRTLLRQQTLAALEQVDLLLSPTLGRTAQPLGPDPVIGSRAEANRTPWLLTTAASLANQPALSVPCGFSAEGLPIGLQISGRPYAESAILQAAYAYEQATPWHTRRPPAA